MDEVHGEGVSGPIYSERFQGRTANWCARNWEAIYVVVKFIEIGALLTIAGTVVAFAITHW